MIEINLLPKEFRKQESRLPLENVPKMLLCILVIFVFLHIAFSILVGLNRYSLTRLTKQYDYLLPQKREIDDIKADLANLNEKLRIASSLTSNRMRWAKILNTISDIIPPNIWLEKVSLEEKSNSFLIHGNVLERDTDAMSAVGQFINALKSDAVFSSSFNKIELEAINKRDVKGADVSEFKIICFLSR